MPQTSVNSEKLRSDAKVSAQVKMFEQWVKSGNDIQGGLFLLLVTTRLILVEIDRAQWHGAEGASSGGKVEGSRV